MKEEPPAGGSFFDYKGPRVSVTKNIADFQKEMAIKGGSICERP
jgi:hypothetical protein